MASLYKRPRSPFWWIKYKNNVTGKVVRESTHLRFAFPAESRAAAVLESKRTTEELQSGGVTSEMAWDVWVPDFLKAKHASNALTLQRYEIIWHTLRQYLREQDIPLPVNLTRAHCLAYPSWRGKSGHFGSTKKGIHHNTVLLELKVLSIICGEAVIRGWIQGNPAGRLGLKRVAATVKRELNDEHVRIIRAEIDRLKQKAQTREEKQNATFLDISFEIATRQGIRLKETNLDLTLVDFDAMEIQIHAKGDRHYSAPLNPDLAPLLKGLLAAGRTTAYDAPRMPSLNWFKLFDRLREKHPEMKRMSFHSTRVTVISRLERSGAPESQTMKLVNHASTTVHRSYRRIKKDELAPYWNALNAAGDDKPARRESPGAAPANPKRTGRSSGGRG